MQHEDKTQKLELHREVAIANLKELREIGRVFCEIADRHINGNEDIGTVTVEFTSVVLTVAELVVTLFEHDDNSLTDSRILHCYVATGFATAEGPHLEKQSDPLQRHAHFPDPQGTA